jgi:hypothetical protein
MYACIFQVSATKYCIHLAFFLLIIEIILLINQLWKYEINRKRELQEEARLTVEFRGMYVGWTGLAVESFG